MSYRPLAFHPLTILLFSLIGASSYALYAALRVSKDQLPGHLFYVVPIVILQVIYLKYFVWHDYITSTSGIVLGALAAFVIWRFGERSEVQRLIDPAS